MAWPKGRERPKKVTTASEAGSLRIESAREDGTQSWAEAVSDFPREPDLPPSGWHKGALLNVRNHGAEYVITLWPEEYDVEHEERCIKFTNLGLCQDFVSRWYARESHDPRAR